MYFIDTTLLEGFINNQGSPQPLEIQCSIVPLDLTPIEQEMLYTLAAFPGRHKSKARGQVNNFPGKVDKKIKRFYINTLLERN